MNFKTTYGLFIALVAIVAIFALSQLFGPSKAGSEDLVFASMKNPKVTDSDITRVEIDHPGAPADKVVFERASSKDRWRMTQPYQTRVESFQVDNMVRDLVRLKRDEASSDLPRDLKSNGLEPPTVTVTLAKGADKTWTLSLGNETPGSAARKLVSAVSSEHPNEPIAVHRQDLENVYKKPKEFRDKALVLESTLNALAVDLKDAKTEIALAKSDDPTKMDLWRFTKPDLGEADYHGEGTANMPPGQPVQRIGSVRDLLVAIEQLRVGYNPETKVDEFVAENVSDVDLAKKYGLEKGKPQTLRIEVKSKTTGLRPGDELGGGKGTTTEALLIGAKVPSEKKVAPKDKDKPADAKDKDKPADAKDKDKPADAKDKDKDKPADAKDKDKPADAKDKDKDKPADAKDKDKPADAKDKPAIDPDAKYYARLEGEHNVVRVPGKSIQAILDVLGNTTALRNKDLLDLDTKTIDAIDIKNADGLVKLRKVGDPAKWHLVEDGKLRDADTQAVNLLLNMLTTKRQVKDFPSQPDDKLGLDAKSNPDEITLWADGIKDKKDTKTEPRLGKETVRLTVAAKAVKDLVYVKRQRDKETMALAVPEGLLTRVNEGRLAYLDKSLPTFKSDDEVVKLVLRRPDSVVELDLEKANKDDKTGTWKVKSPAEQAGRKADFGKVAQVVDVVRNLFTDKLVSEKASEADLDRFGLKPGDYQVTVTLKKGDKTEDRVYLFGRETEKKDNRYAKQGERDMVFMVRPEVIDSIKAKDFVDAQVFHFDAAKVRGVKLTGWRDPKAGPRVLHMELKEAKPGEPRTWVLTEESKKGNPDLHLDGAKTTQFVQELAKLTASRYLVFKSGPKPEYKLDEKSRALEVEITVEGEAKPLTLYLGAPVTEGDVKGYAAESSTLPGDVFLLPESPFDKLLKDGPKYFATAK